MNALHDFVGGSSGGVGGSSGAEPLSAIEAIMSLRSAVGTGTRARIIALAVYQLKNGGYAELHFGAIASALGVTRANIHHHFSSKENLAQVAVEEFIEERLCRVQAMIDRFPNDFPNALNSIGEYLQQLSFDHPGEGLCACTALVLNSTGVPSSLKEVSSHYFRELSDLFQDAILRSQKAGTVQDAVSAEDLAWECVLLMMGIGVLSGSLEAHERSYHPVPALLKKKARRIGALSQDFLRAG